MGARDAWTTARDWVAAERVRLGLHTAEMPCPICGLVSEGVASSPALAEGIALGAWESHVQHHLAEVDCDDDV